ncbi:hypothetical protein EU527_09890 [Candidatus Thorarchaeota archaeon]|nr:MAG: hypothetical protein EU527_09890 [Candidatus Thorarchaeota archaeon]
MPLLEKIDVRFWIKEECSRGTLIINREGMFLKLDSGQIISSDTNRNLTYEMQIQITLGSNEKQVLTKLEKPTKILFKPIVKIYRKYTLQNGQYTEDIFPPSTNGFYARMKRGYKEFLFIVQEVIDDSRYWLTIADPSSGVINEAYIITHYEAESLSLIDSQEFRRIWDKKIWATIPAAAKDDISSILDGPSASWDDLSKMLEDVSIPNLKLGATMRETLSPLIPSSIPEDIREQLILFLAYISRRNIPNEDPIDYLSNFWSLPFFSALLQGHLMCLADGITWPSYLKLLILASRKHLDAPVRAIDTNVSDSPWLLFWEKIMERFPNWFDIAMDIIKELNAKGEAITKCPIGQTTVKRSMEQWKKRLAILMYELRLVGRSSPQLIGLTELVYLGAAYRWPHRHMKFITKLGVGIDNPPYLQVMVMPPSAAIQVKRALPSIMNVIWTMRSLNIDLFNSQDKRWEVSIQQIITSLDGTYSLKRMMNRYGNGKRVQRLRISPEEAKVIDFATEGIRLAVLERKEYLEPWKLDIKRVQRILSSLSKRGVIRLTYEATNEKLISLATIANGPSKKVTSLCSSFLDNTPSTLVMLGENSEQAIMLSRVPETSAHELVSRLPKLGLDEGLVIRCLRPVTFQSYTHNLYQRLLRDDGTWDDDVTAFLSQARSRRKEMSESNA